MGKELFKMALGVIAVGVVILLLIALNRGIQPNYAVGNVAAVVVKVELRGIYHPMWVGEAVLVPPQGVAPSIFGPKLFKFSVDPNYLTEVLALQRAVASGDRVVLSYHQWGLAPMLDIPYDYVVMAVEETRAPKP